MISGINGTNCILAGMAKARIEKQMIEGANVVGTKGSYLVEFFGKASSWNGHPLQLCSVRNPYEPRVFKSMDGAISQLQTLGLNSVKVIATE